jgi:hypothetical protein
MLIRDEEMKLVEYVLRNTCFTDKLREEQLDPEDDACVVILFSLPYFLKKENRRMR